MWQTQLLAVTLLALIMPPRAANTQQYKRFNDVTSGLDAWQPQLTQHNNWFILQATAASNRVMQQAAEEQPVPLPVNYYAHNHRYNHSLGANGLVKLSGGSGNYKQLRSTEPEATVAPPSYVLAISQAMRRQLPPTKSAQAQHWLQEHADVAANEVDADDVAIDNDSEEQLDAYLAPLERALVKVRDFCDIVKHIISHENEPELEDALSSASSSQSTVTEPRAGSTTSKEVQGRQNRQQSAGGGRRLKKLKKKFKKLLLPLLIAYKLKFLTLIPVLIGGLTLLVGTTGLAGFFFALFTAVMSLKGSGGGGGGGYSSKAIVYKKI